MGVVASGASVSPAVGEKANKGKKTGDEKSAGKGGREKTKRVSFQIQGANAEEGKVQEVQVPSQAGCESGSKRTQSGLAHSAPGATSRCQNESLTVVDHKQFFDREMLKSLCQGRTMVSLPPVISPRCQAGFSSPSPNSYSKSNQLRNPKSSQL